MSGSPVLVEVGAASTGRRIDLPSREMLVLGRDASADVVFDDDTVSRRHATLQWRDGEAWLADLHSTGGTYVNGKRVTVPRRLVLGDRIELGATILSYGDPGDVGTRLVPRVSGPDTHARFDVDRQSAGTINNVGRDQHLAYLHVQQQRESFVREVARTRTKARWLIWLGALVTIGGCVLYGRIFLGMVQLMGDFVRSAEAGDEPDMSVWFDRMGDAVIGLGIVAAGSFLLFLGMVFHIVATSRRKRVERAYPPPPGWSTAASMSRQPTTPWNGTPP